MKRIFKCLMIGLCFVISACSSEVQETNSCDGKEEGFVLSVTDDPCIVEYCYQGHATLGNAVKGYSCTLGTEQGVCDGQQVCALCDGKYPGELLGVTECEMIYCATTSQESLIAKPVSYPKEECQ